MWRLPVLQVVASKWQTQGHQALCEHRVCTCPSAAITFKQTKDHASAMCAGMGRMGNGQDGGVEMMQCVKVGKLNLVDLAGSERVHITGATGEMSTMQRIFVNHLWDQAMLLHQGCWSQA